MSTPCRKKGCDIMNTEVKRMIKDAGLKHWQIADMCGISEATLVRWLRHVLTPDQENQIKKAIMEVDSHVSIDKSGR